MGGRTRQLEGRPGQLVAKQTMGSVMPSFNLKDEGDLLYTTLVGMVMAAIFATSLHKDVDETLTSMAPEGTFYPFPAHTREPAAILASAITGFILGVAIWSFAGLIRWACVRRLLAYRDWIYNPRSKKTKAWGLALKLLIPKRRLLYAFQHVLPKLPLPTLDDTCKLILRNTKALITDKEFNELEKDLEEFKNGEGKALHAALEQRFIKEENWVSDLWDSYAYLAYRDPIAINLNVSASSAVNKSDLKYFEEAKQVGRAAAIGYQYLRLNEMIKDEGLHPILVQDTVPLCMDRYRYMTSCTRIPGKGMDSLKTYNSKHIVVMRKNHMFKLEVYALTADGEESLLTPEELQMHLEIIMKMASTMGKREFNPAVMTGQNRDTWAEERNKLREDKLNAASLEDVESAIFHLVLEDTSPKNLSEEGKSNLCGDGYNRWYDKSITVTVYENSVCGVNMEHTTADGTILSRMMEYTWAKSQWDAVGNAISSGLPRHYKMAKPKEIKWNLDAFEQSLPIYQSNLLKMINNLDAHCKVLTHGKRAIKKCKTSPDDFMQMALQLAFYRMHKFIPKTYESASTRFFKYGRTDTIRTATIESKLFVESMENPEMSDKDRAALLRKAISGQHKYKLLATNGLGSDRHLFGLYIMAKMQGIMPKLFSHKVLFEPDHLSTSQCPYFYDKELATTMTFYPSGGNFGPQRSDGYGAYYIFLGEDNVNIHITSDASYPDTNSEKFGKFVEEAMLDMRRVLTQK